MESWIKIFLAALGETAEQRKEEDQILLARASGSEKKASDEMEIGSDAINFFFLLDRFRYRRNEPNGTMGNRKREHEALKHVS